MPCWPTTACCWPATPKCRPSAPTASRPCACPAPSPCKNPAASRRRAAAPRWNACACRVPPPRPCWTMRRRAGCGRVRPRPHRVRPPIRPPCWRWPSARPTMATTPLPPPPATTCCAVKARARPRPRRPTPTTCLAWWPTSNTKAAPPTTTGGAASTCGPTTTTPCAAWPCWPNRAAMTAPPPACASAPRGCSTAVTWRRKEGGHDRAGPAADAVHRRLLEPHRRERRPELPPPAGRGPLPQLPRVRGGRPAQPATARRSGLPRRVGGPFQPARGRRRCRRRLRPRRAGVPRPARVAGPARRRCGCGRAAGALPQTAPPQPPWPAGHRQRGRQADPRDLAGSHPGHRWQHRRGGPGPGPGPPRLSPPPGAACGRPALRHAGGGAAWHHSLPRAGAGAAAGHGQQGPGPFRHRGLAPRRAQGGGARRAPTGAPAGEVPAMSQDGDLSQFSMLDLFRLEADGQARILTDGLLAFESGSGSAATAEALMRAAHSIKGAAAIVGLDVVVQLAHAMEDAFIDAQHGRLPLTPARVDVLLASVDLIVQVSTLTEAQLAAWLGEQAERIGSVMTALAGLAELQGEPAPAPAAPGESPPAAEPPPAAAAAAQQNYDQLLALASESRIHAHQLQPALARLQRFKRHQASLIKAVEQLHEALVRSADPGLIEQAALALQKTQPLKQALYEHMTELDSYERRVLAVSNHLVDEVLALRMRPFRDGVHMFPRMVRDLARSLGKEAALTITGEDTLVDRDILARIESPLNHMLRNAVDHGIETPAARLAAGKAAAGAVRLEAFHSHGMLAIVISDDGAGVDLERIRDTVVRRKLASAAMAAAMSAAELLEFLFLPAFSLRDTASAISGRGVGLDIVQQAIRAQNGSVRLETAPGQGMRTHITLPLTQSIVRALVVDVQGEAYAIPIVKVERVCKLAASALHTLENKQFFELDGDHLGLVSAAQLLELGQLTAGADELPVVVIGSGARRYALVVDAIVGEQSLAVQPLDAVFGKLRDIAACAQLDDGAPVLILDTADLLVSIDKLLGEGGLHQLAQGADGPRQQARRVLVVDDSLTVREMEKKLLLARGYRVDLAIDGIDGWNVVRSGDYDLVITDVDMPRMDGIELTTLI